MQSQLIAGRYQVLRSIGRGGMGTVWLCRDEVLGREVAVKQIGALPGESATETKRAMREARSAAALNHPNAVAVYDVVDHDGRPWLVMEYVEGQTLADEIAHDGQLSPQRVADIGAQLAGALARAHERRIVHRDIKPGNVLIDKAGRPKISDFGIARGHGDDQLTQIGFITGTPGYLSPELARGGDPHSASDVWALGATLYTAVEGQAPYEPRSNPIALLRVIATERPRPMTHAGALAPAIDAMMHEDPARRWDMATSAKQLGGIARTAAVMAQVLARTAVIGEPPFEPTQALGPTQRLEVAAPVADLPVATVPVAELPVATVPVAELPVVPVPVAELPVVPVLVAELPVAPASVAAEQAGRHPELQGPHNIPGVAPVTPGKDRTSTRRWLPLVSVALLVAIAVFYLLSQVGDSGGATAGTNVGTTTRITPAGPGATGAPKISEPPRATSSAPSRVTPAPAPNAGKRLDNFVKSYYSEVTRDTGLTWGHPKPGMEQRFLGYYLSQVDYSQSQDRQIKGNTLNKSKIDRIPVPVPSMPEQTAIADTLDAARRLIDIEREAAVTTRRLARAVGQKVFSVDPEGDTEGWVYERIGDSHDVSSGGTPSRPVPEYWAGGTIPWVKTTEVNYSVITETSERITQRGLDGSAARVLPAGTVLLAMYGQGVTRGKVAILGIEAATNQACAAIQATDGAVDSHYLYQYLAFQYEELRRMAHGGQQQNLNLDIVRDFPISYPVSRETQRELVQVLESLDRKAHLHESRLAGLRRLFKALLHQLMSRELRVDGLDPSTLPTKQRHLEGALA